MRIPVTGPSYPSGIVNFQNQKCFNWYVESDQMANSDPAKHQSILRPTEGITSLYDFGDFTAGRASLVVDGICYCIIDDTFMFLDSSGLPNYIDVLNTSSGWVSMARGASGILMADGVHAYYYDLTTLTFSVIADTHGAFPNAFPTSLVYLDGWYVMTFESSQIFIFSDDPTDWPTLQFESVNSDPDYTVYAVSDHEQLWFFGQDTTEVWTSTGDGNAPFARYSGVVITKGCSAPASIVAANNAFYWLGAGIEGGIGIYTVSGFSPQLISKPISTRLQEYTTYDDAFAFYHKIGYHEFYVITFPTEHETWAYDVAEGQWHQRGSVISTDPTDPSYSSDPVEHRAATHAYANGTHYVTDRYTGAIAKYDSESFKEFDIPLRRQRRTSILAGDPTGMGFLTYDNCQYVYNHLILDVLPGVGLGAGDTYENPVISLRISKDGGFTWGPVLTRGLGAQGAYTDRVIWDSLGQARDMVLDFQITDPVNAVIMGATVQRQKCSF